ncbi:unnamed protein product [Chrysoparadoxa australica]
MGARVISITDFRTSIRTGITGFAESAHGFQMTALLSLRNLVTTAVLHFPPQFDSHDKLKAKSLAAMPVPIHLAPSICTATLTVGSVRLSTALYEGKSAGLYVRIQASCKSSQKDYGYIVLDAIVLDQVHTGEEILEHARKKLSPGETGDNYDAQTRTLMLEMAQKEMLGLWITRRLALRDGETPFIRCLAGDNFGTVELDKTLFTPRMPPLGAVGRWKPFHCNGELHRSASNTQEQEPGRGGSVRRGSSKHWDLLRRRKAEAKLFTAKRISEEFRMREDSFTFAKDSTSGA